MPQDTLSVVNLKHEVDTSHAASANLKKGYGEKKTLPKTIFNTPDSNGNFNAYGPATALFPDSNAKDSFISYLPVKKEFRFSDIDTVRYESFEKTVNPVPKLFSGHKLMTIHNNPQMFNKPNPDWFTIILLGIVFGFMWIRVFYYKILKQIVNAFINSSVSNQIVRDENILIQRASIMLSVMFYLVAALFLYQVSVTFQWESEWLTDGFSRFIIFAFFIAFAYSSKLIILKLTGYVLDIDKPVASYIFNIFLMNNILGIILFPFVILIAYVHTPFTFIVFWTAIVVIILTFMYRLIRGVAIGMSIPKFSIFHLFLYLCAFEIAPLALIFKLAAF